MTKRRNKVYRQKMHIRRLKKALQLAEIQLDIHKRFFMNNPDCYSAYANAFFDLLNEADKECEP